VSLTALQFSHFLMFFYVHLNTQNILYNKGHGVFFVTWHYYSIDTDMVRWVEHVVYVGSSCRNLEGNLLEYGHIEE
jgi:hypothetical protein